MLENSGSISTAKLLAPEDVDIGQYVIIHEQVFEYIQLGGDNAPTPSVPSVTRIAAMPCGERMVYRVHAVCLPYVLVKSVSNRYRSLDLREHRLASVSETYGRVMRRACRTRKAKDTKKRKKKS